MFVVQGAFRGGGGVGVGDITGHKSCCVYCGSEEQAKVFA